MALRGAHCNAGTPLASGEPKKAEAQTRHKDPWLQKMCAAERGQEVVNGHFVGEIGDSQRRDDLLAAFGMEQVVGAEAQIQKVPWFTRSG